MKLIAATKEQQNKCVHRKLEIMKNEFRYIYVIHASRSIPN